MNTDKPTIAVIDYGMGNIRSVSKALEFVGAKVVVSDNKNKLKSVDGVVLPGVGSFAPAIAFLRKSSLIKTIEDIIEQNKYFLGLCLGFQLLFGSSSEEGTHKGLKVISGKVVKFNFKNIKIPHMGWNNVKFTDTKSSKKMFSGIPNNSYFYFVHSYYGIPDKKDIVSGITDYGGNFCSAIVKDNVWACQFHPEKSGRYGLKLLKNFVQAVR